MMSFQAPYWFVLGPTLLLLASAVAMWLRSGPARLLVGLSVAAALVMEFFVPVDGWRLGGLLAGDGLVRALAVILLTAAGGVVAFAGRTSDEEPTRSAGGPALVALSAASALVALAADDIYLLVGSLEMAYLPSLWMAVRGRGRQVQTGFLSAGISAALVLWGAATLANQAGVPSLAAWPAKLAWSPTVGLALAAFSFGLAWKLMILPFGLGAFEMFEGAPWPAVPLLQTVFLPAAVLAVGRVVLALSPTQKGAELLLIFGALGVSFSGFALVWRRSLRALSLSLGPLAASWLLVTWVAQGYLLGDAGPSFVLMTGAWCAALLALAVAGYGMEGPGEEPIPGGRMPARWYGLGKSEPFLAIGLLAAVASALGSPFTAGFVSRLAMLRGLVDVSTSATILLVVAWVVGLQPLITLGSVFYGADLPASMASSRTRPSVSALAVLWAGAAVGIAAGLLPGGTWRLILAAFGL